MAIAVLMESRSSCVSAASSRKVSA
jgi:hypothetical protein